MASTRHRRAASSTSCDQRHADRSASGSFQVRDERDTAHRVGDLRHRDELPAVLAERVEDLTGVVLEERRDEVLPLLHRCLLGRWAGCYAAPASRLLVVRMQTPMITVRPASSAMRRASSFTIPSWSHRTLPPRATAASATGGVSAARRNTSTTSITMSSGMSPSEAYARSPRTSVSVGFTGKIR